MPRIAKEKSVTRGPLVTGVEKKRRGPKPKPLSEKVKTWTFDKPKTRQERSYTRERKIEVLMYLVNHRIGYIQSSRKVARRRIGQYGAEDRPVIAEDGSVTWYRAPTYAEASEWWKIPIATISNWWEHREKILEGTGIELPQKPTPSEVTGSGDAPAAPQPQQAPKPKPPTPEEAAALKERQRQWLLARGRAPVMRTAPQPASGSAPSHPAPQDTPDGPSQQTTQVPGQPGVQLNPSFREVSGCQPHVQQVPTGRLTPSARVVEVSECQPRVRKEPPVRRNPVPIQAAPGPGQQPRPNGVQVHHPPPGSIPAPPQAPVQKSPFPHHVVYVGQVPIEGVFLQHPATVAGYAPPSTGGATPWVVLYYGPAPGTPGGFPLPGQPSPSPGQPSYELPTHPPSAHPRHPPPPPQQNQNRHAAQAQQSAAAPPPRQPPAVPAAAPAPSTQPHPASVPVQGRLIEPAPKRQRHESLPGSGAFALDAIPAPDPPRTATRGRPRLSGVASRPKAPRPAAVLAPKAGALWSTQAATAPGPSHFDGAVVITPQHYAQQQLKKQHQQQQQQQQQQHASAASSTASNIQTQLTTTIQPQQQSPATRDIPSQPQQPQEQPEQGPKPERQDPEEQQETSDSSASPVEESALQLQTALEENTIEAQAPNGASDENHAESEDGSTPYATPESGGAAEVEDQEMPDVEAPFVETAGAETPESVEE